MTKAQERAKAKLTHEWQSAHELDVGLTLLEGLVARKEAIMKREPMKAHRFKLHNFKGEALPTTDKETKK